MMLPVTTKDGFVILPTITNVLIPTVNNQVILPTNPKEFLDNSKITC
jgi:hypothetical protein